MTLRERIIIDLSLRLLSAAAAAAANGCVDTPEVRLALHCLRRYCPDERLADFWRWAEQLPNANRAENCTASLADIVAALDAAGALPTDEASIQALMPHSIKLMRFTRDRQKASHRAHYFRPPTRKR